MRPAISFILLLATFFTISLTLPLLSSNRPLTLVEVLEPRQSTNSTEAECEAEAENGNLFGGGASSSGCASDGDTSSTSSSSGLIGGGSAGSASSSNTSSSSSSECGK